MATILLVGVDLFFRGKLDVLLDGHRLTTADSVDPPDLVIVDLARVDADEVAETYPDIPILGFTTHTDTAGLRAAHEAGLDRVVVRSAYLFGGRIARGVWEEEAPPLESLYARMYPAGGAAQGYLEAGRSFLASGFAPEAEAALGSAVRAGKRAKAGSRRRTPAGDCAREAKRLLSGMSRPAA